MSEFEIIKKSKEPLTVEKMKLLSEKAGVKKGMTIIVHVSLSALGWICGGAQALIDALIETVGQEGTLVMPAHSGDLSNPELWSDPPVPDGWIQTIKDNMPAYNRDKTPTRGLGKTAEIFRKYPGVIRSSHPLYSFCAYGKNSERITENHQFDNGIGMEKPLQALYDIDSYVLLLGVENDNNTSLHLAEYSNPLRKLTKSECPVMINGKREWVQFDDIELECNETLIEIGKFLQGKGVVSETDFGIGKALFMRQRDAVDCARDYYMGIN